MLMLENSDTRTEKFFKQDPTFRETEFGSGCTYSDCPFLRGDFADFACLVISAKLQTGDEKYKFLEDSIFVGSQRFIFTPPNTLALEFKLSQVVQDAETDFSFQGPNGELRRAN